MKQLLEKWTLLTEKIDSFQPRERVIITITLSVGIWIAAMVLLIEPVLEQRAELSSELQTLRIETTENEAQLKILEIEYSVDPNKKPRARLRELTHQLRRIESDIESKSKHLVPARKTAQVLQDMLQSQTGLYLTKLEKLAPVIVPILDQAQKTPQVSEKEVAALADIMKNSDLEHVKVLMSVVESTDPFLKRMESQTNIYKHGVKMHVDGQFLDVLSYIVMLEKMDWKVYWKTFEYQSGEYPMGKASFIIETLGFDNGWIGV